MLSTNELMHTDAYGRYKNSGECNYLRDEDGIRTFSKECEDAETFSTISRGDEFEELSDD